MAVDFPGNRTSEYRIDPSLIRIDPNLNGRFKLPPIDTLVADMLSKPDGRVYKGQTTPVTIRKDGRANGKETPVLVYGHRRLRSVVEINRRIAEGEMSGPPWTLRCCYSQMNEVEALAAAVSENIEREGVTPIDHAYNIKQFVRLGQDYKWIALNGGFFPKLRRWVDDGTHGHEAELKKAVAKIKKWERLLDLVPEAQAQVADGCIKESAAVELAKMEATRQRELLRREKPITIKDVKPVILPVKVVSPAVDKVRSEICVLVHEGTLPTGEVVDEMEPRHAIEVILQFLSGVCDRLKEAK